MRYHCSGYSLQLRRQMRKIHDAGCNDDPTCAHDLTRGGRQFKTIRIRREGVYLDFFQLRHIAALKFLPIVDERLDMDRKPDILVRNGVLTTIGFERKLGVRIIETGSESLGLEAHPARHVMGPEPHRFAKNPKTSAASLQMGRQGQAVGPGADNGDVDSCCAQDSLQKVQG